MNEHLYEITCGNFAVTDLPDEEIMCVTANEKLRTNRKKRFHKEIMKHGKESDYDFYG